MRPLDVDIRYRWCDTTRQYCGRENSGGFHLLLHFLIWSNMGTAPASCRGRDTVQPSSFPDRVHCEHGLKSLYDVSLRIDIHCPSERLTACDSDSPCFHRCIVCGSPYLLSLDYVNLGAKMGFIFGGITTVGTILVYFYLPETKDRTLEEIDEMFLNVSSPPPSPLHSITHRGQYGRWKVLT